MLMGIWGILPMDKSLGSIISIPIKWPRDHPILLSWEDESSKVAEH